MIIVHTDLLFVILYLRHCPLGAFSHAFATLDAFVIIYHRETFGVLGDSSDRTRFNQRTNVVVRAYIFVHLYHNRIFFHKISPLVLFDKTDFI